MNRRIVLLAGLLVVGAPAYAAWGDELIRVEQCHTSRTPQARADCERRRNELERAYRRERQQKLIDESRAQRNSTLCFKRGATREAVCPN